jgi:co-chaperonin GroES (HSP10)|tara:strand:- start:119 stop:370 length:252 start_codon:yes stop_codon:yes gene_type:complete
MKALGSRVIVKVVAEDAVSSTGIHTGNAARPDRGEVMSIGHHVDDPSLEVGDKVIFSEHAGKAVTEGKVEYILLNYSELYSKL